jgi:hypothetical protein
MYSFVWMSNEQLKFPWKLHFENTFHRYFKKFQAEIVSGPQDSE